MSKTIYPTGLAYIPGVPAVQQDVTAERAAELLAYRPAAFTLDPKAAAAGDTLLYLGHSPDSPPPDAPAISPDGPASAGPLDSPEV